MIKKEDLKLNTPLHKRISDAISSRITLSQNWMSRRYSQWATNEELFNAYLPEKDNDRVRKAENKSQGLQDFVTVEVPYTYAIALTAHTYYTSVFMARNPILQFAGRHGESEMQTQAVEAVMDYQMNVGRMLMPMYIWLLDPLKYGVGFVGHYWDSEQVPMTKKITVQPNFLGITLPYSKAKEQYVTEMVQGYQGNRVYNVRPQDAFPDPRVAMWNFQAGEFFGRYVELPLAELHSGETSGRFFNTQEAIAKQKEGGGAGQGVVGERDQGSSRVTTLPSQEGAGFLSMGKMDLPLGVLKSYQLYLRLVPRDWGFSDSNAMEIWVITMSREKVIIGLEPLGDASNLFPFDIIEHEPGGYSSFSRSMMEISEPLNKIISWLFNTHFYNVRAALNNQFLVDPSRINLADVQDPGPGKIFRLLPTAYGQDVRTMITQFPVSDITRANMQDLQGVAELIQRVFGVTDNVMGAVNPGGRKTATEVRTSTSLAVNRLKTQCEMMSATGFAPFAQKLLQRTQLNLQLDRYYKIVGDLSNFSQPFVQVDREKIAGFFDFVPVDGTMPIDRFAQAALWQEMISSIYQVPQVAAQYDFGKIFAWVASLAGMKNVQQFKIQLAPDAQLLAAAQAGNVVPMKPPAAASGTPTVPQVGRAG